MADEHVRRRYLRPFEKLMQVIGNRLARPRSGRRIAPTFTSTIIPANVRDLRNAGLRQNPLVAPVLQNHSGAPLAQTRDVQASASNIHRVADAKWTRAVAPAAQLLIGKACGGENQKKEAKRP